MKVANFEQAKQALFNIQRAEDNLSWIGRFNGKQINIPDKVVLSQASIDRINAIVKADLTKQLRDARREFANA